MAVNEAELALLEVEMEGRLGDAIESGGAALGLAPEGLDAIDMALPPGEFIGAVVDPVMLLVAHIHEAVVSLPTVAVNGDFFASRDPG